ncbi:MAG: hypothetical protein FWG10_04805 [Eubacteriaceae bacterium]|nr:hypothetical protein [Eubacteriaceae bacterium]
MSLEIFSRYFELLIPIAAFLLLFSCLLFILYLKTRFDSFYLRLNRFFADISRIASELEKGSQFK